MLGRSLPKSSSPPIDSERVGGARVAGHGADHACSELRRDDFVGLDDEDPIVS